MGLGGDIPDDRTMLGEGQKTMDAYGQLAPQIYGMYSQYAPLYANAGSGAYLNAVGSLYPSMSGYVNGADSSYRQSFIGDFDALGTGAGEAIKGISTPQGALTDLMGSQSEAEVKNAGNLSARDRYDMKQSAMVDANRRGAAASNYAVQGAMENTQKLKDERQDRANAYASNAADLNNSFYSYPAFEVLSGGSSVPGLASSAAGQSGFGITPSTFNPWESSYASDIYNSNYNAAWAEYENDRTEIPKMVGAGLGMIGSIVGGIFGGPLGAKIGGTAGRNTGYGFGTLAMNI